MQIPLQVTLRNVNRSPALLDRIRDKAEGLERFHPRITHCRVTVSQSDKHHQQGRQFEVRIDVRTPGRAEIAVTRQHDEDVQVALREAFAAVTRELEDVVRTKRGQVKHHEVAAKGEDKRAKGPVDMEAPG
jgi:ribosome-associated translation inhibitor RaiA